MAELVDRVNTASLVDAMGRLHRHRCHVLDLVSPNPNRPLFGPAVTISFFPSCSEALDPERYNFGRLFYEAIGDDPAGRVLVLAANGHPEASVGGGTKLSRLENHGMAGVLTDARLRDFEELRSYDFAAYCSGEATRWGGDVITPFQANVPVVVGRVGIVPGQYVYADSSGAVVIPDPQVREVLETAAQIESDDAAFLDKIRNEKREDVMGGAGAGEA
ncbi:MAG: RraA family protein [Solirubrobacterales bacterium]